MQRLLSLGLPWLHCVPCSCSPHGRTASHCIKRGCPPETHLRRSQSPMDFLSCLLHFHGSLHVTHSKLSRTGLPVSPESHPLFVLPLVFGWRLAKCTQPPTLSHALCLPVLWSSVRKNQQQRLAKVLKGRRRRSRKLERKVPQHRLKMVTLKLKRYLPQTPPADWISVLKAIAGSFSRRPHVHNVSLYCL